MLDSTKTITRPDSKEGKYESLNVVEMMREIADRSVLQMRDR